MNLHSDTFSMEKDAKLIKDFVLSTILFCVCNRDVIKEVVLIETQVAFKIKHDN